MDEADRAQELEYQHRAAALERRVMAARGVEPGPGDVRDSADECMECGELIPSARQIAVPGCQLCVECAERIEREVRGR